MFSTTLISQYDEVGRIVIKVEGADTVSIYPDGRGGSHGHTTGLVIVECDAGGRVWIECTADLSRFHVNIDFHLNTFSGMLVHAF